MADDDRPYVSVKFSRVGRVHSYLLADVAADTPIAGERVVVCDGAAGPAHAVVVRSLPQLIARRQPPSGSTRIVMRLASTDDRHDLERLADRERHAYQFCLMKIRERGLPMKLTRVEQLADRSKIVFYFTAEGRVDFRELVRDLAAEFRMRIELRQIGVRDEARMVGGYGPCGRALCCTVFLDTFEPVSIKMAKAQHLSLNPAKLSGVCGRLKCCLRYELGATPIGRQPCGHGAGNGNGHDDAATPGAEARAGNGRCCDAGSGAQDAGGGCCCGAAGHSDDDGGTS